MTLTPVTRPRLKIVKSEVDWSEPKSVYDWLMKMDEEEVRALTTMVAVEVVNDTIAKNLPAVQRHLDEVVAKRVEVAKRAIAAKIKKDGSSPELEEMAREVVELSKANQYDFGYKFSEHDVRRDATGRFATHINPTLRRRPVKGKGAPRIPEFRDENNKKVTLKPYQQAHYQNEYQQVSSFLRTLQDSGMDLKNDAVRMRLKNTKTGETYSAALETKNGRPEPVKHAWDPRFERVLSIEARPETLTAGGATFNLLSAFGKPGTARNVARGVNNAGKNLPEFSRHWYANDPDLENSSLYNRLGAGGKYIAQIAPEGSKMQMAASYSAFVGQHGPEAEKVFGPPTRRAMYRYRGTQKKVDEDEITRETPAPARGGQKRGDMISSEPRAMGLQRTPEGRTLPVGYGDRWGRYVDYLSRRLPDRHHIALQLASGHTPPSEGIILDKNGKATVQAIGYGDDHYLPFNLKQLTGLKGGEYIRTRTSGGPTSEDVYTGLMSGAKAITVVSHSGTFRVEFQPDFKGTRRYNQKAIRMVGRYQRLLDAVRSQQVERRAMDPVEQRKIEEQVRADYAHLDEPELAQMVRDEVNAAKANTKLPPDKQSDYEKRVAEHELDPSLSANDKYEYRATLYSSMLEEYQPNWKLNNRGYEAALEGLRQQFPYYIKRVDHDPRNHMADYSEPGTDRGFVRAGALLPIAARGNFFEGIGAEAKKFSTAEKLNYGQLGLKFRSAGLRQPEETTSTPTDTADTAAPDTAGAGSPSREGSGASESPMARAKKKVQEQKATKAFADTLIDFRKSLPEAVVSLDYPADHSAPWLKMSEPELREWARDGENRKAAIDWLDHFDSHFGEKEASKQVPNFKANLGRLKRDAGAFGGKKFTVDDLKMAGEEAFDFSDEGPEYTPGAATTEYRQNAIHKLGDPYDSLTIDKRKISGLNETELRKELETAVEMRGYVQAAVELPKNEDQRSKVQAGMVQVSADKNLNHWSFVSRSLKDNDMKHYDEYLLSLHKIRAIRAAEVATPNPKVPPEELGKRAGLATSIHDLAM